MEVDSHNTNTKENTNTSNDANDCKKNEELRYDVELTRAIKENHGTPIVDARICPFEGGEAFFVTCASNQVNIYDLEVRGNFMSTLLNYRNWHLETMRAKNIVWKEHLEKNHPKDLEKKAFNSVCWMKRFADFYVAAADNEQQIHLLSLTNCQCMKIIKTDKNINHLIAFPLYPNILCMIDVDNKCQFMNISNEEIIFTLPDKISKIRFAPSGDKFVVVLTNGSIREYAQKVEIMDDDMKEINDEDEDVDLVSNNNNNSNNKVHKSNKRLMVNSLNTYKTDDKGSDICEIRYCGNNIVIIGNEEGEFKMINMDSIQLLNQWKVSAPIEKGNVSAFDVNKNNDCVVFGNGAHQVQVYDLKKKKYLRKVDTGRGRKLPFSFAMFCKHHPQSIITVCDSVVMKFDPLELVKDYFPSTADFATQKRNGVQLFNTVMTVQYEADKVKN